MPINQCHCDVIAFEFLVFEKNVKINNAGVIFTLQTYTTWAVCSEGITLSNVVIMWFGVGYIRIAYTGSYMSIGPNWKIAV